MSDTPTIDVLYTCDKCGTDDRTVKVEERKPDEDILDWMFKVQVALAHDHDKHSPHCRITQFTNAKIPLPHGSDVIGRAERH